MKALKRAMCIIDTSRLINAALQNISEKGYKLQHHRCQHGGLPSNRQGKTWYDGHDEGMLQHSISRLVPGRYEEGEIRRSIIIIGSYYKCPTVQALRHMLSNLV